MSAALSTIPNAKSENLDRDRLVDVVGGYDTSDFGEQLLGGVVGNGQASPAHFGQNGPIAIPLGRGVA